VFGARSAFTSAEPDPSRACRDWASSADRVPAPRKVSKFSTRTTRRKGTENTESGGGSVWSASACPEALRPSGMLAVVSRPASRDFGYCPHPGNDRLTRRSHAGGSRSASKPPDGRSRGQPSLIPPAVRWTMPPCRAPSRMTTICVISVHLQSNSYFFIEIISGLNGSLIGGSASGDRLSVRDRHGWYKIRIFDRRCTLITRMRINTNNAKHNP
jgi:hypothetical protein